jgi:hypothetical protein
MFSIQFWIIEDFSDLNRADDFADNRWVDLEDKRWTGVASVQVKGLCSPFAYPAVFSHLMASTGQTSSHSPQSVQVPWSMM